MQLIRYIYREPQPRFGWVWEGFVGPIEGSPFGEYRRLEADVPIEAVQLLPPVEPSKIICINQNYADPANPEADPSPEVPSIFLKPASALIGTGEMVLIPPQAQQVNHEAELAVIIGRQGRWISAEKAGDYIYGYAAANDITARDLLHRDVLWGRAKGFDTFCPIGPWVQTDFDPADAVITCHVNGELRQMASTHEMLFTISRLVAFVSSVMTLMPGDVILTGSPPGSSPVEPGDVIETTIEGIGTLQNKVDVSPTPTQSA